MYAENLRRRSGIVKIPAAFDSSFREMASEGKAGRFAIAALAAAQSLRRRLKTAAVLDAGDLLMWASEYPHYDCEFPGAVRELREHCEVLKPETQRKITGVNAARCYRLF
jgi:hypothetical protein